MLVLYCCLPLKAMGKNHFPYLFQLLELPKFFDPPKMSIFYSLDPVNRLPYIWHMRFS